MFSRAYIVRSIGNDLRNESATPESILGNFPPFLFHRGVQRKVEEKERGREPLEKFPTPKYYVVRFP